jgi:hypothetical protein
MPVRKGGYVKRVGHGHTAKILSVRLSQTLLGPAPPTLPLVCQSPKKYFLGQPIVTQPDQMACPARARQTEQFGHLLDATPIGNICVRLFVPDCDPQNVAQETHVQYVQLPLLLFGDSPRLAAVKQRRRDKSPIEHHPSMYRDQFVVPNVPQLRKLGNR